ncbi:MAG: hypothetical protein RBS73_11210 [Prolixibacteraceae bacterium]|jgi:hypothetical protein|nr:hypothetical protein [Prolixibacteraceae bacterium]
MRPKTPDHEKLGQGVRVRLTALEKRLLLKRCKDEGYLTLSDFCRAKLVKKREIKKVIASKEFVLLVRKLDYELNKVGVNLNQVSKRINSNSIYQFSDGDRQVFKQILGELRGCFSVLQQYMDQIEDSPSQK